MDQTDSDPFTSSREGIVENDENFQSLLSLLKHEVLPKIIDEWDDLRLARGQEGDDENPRKSKKERKARDLYEAARNDYLPEGDAPGKDKVEGWLVEFRSDAAFNISAYVDCFLSENLVRKFITNESIAITEPSKIEVQKWREREKVRKEDAGISFSIRRDDDDLSYLGMDMLAVSAEGGKKDKASLWTDAVKFKPVRNAVGHTGLLTDTAKMHLTVTFENIKARVKMLVSGQK